MPGLELIGPIARCAQTPAPDPEVARIESAGLFVAGDATTIRSYGGGQLGWRWLCRAQGPLIQRVPGWPAGPDGGTAGYFRTARVFAVLHQRRHPDSWKSRPRQ